MPRSSPDRFVRVVGGSSGGGTSTTTLIREVPYGDIDGVNTDFMASQVYLPNSTQLYLNGLLQMEGVDYVEIGVTSVRFDDPPQVGDKVILIFVAA